MDIVTLIQTGNIDELRTILNQNPDMLEKNFNWGGGYGGYVLNCAAYYNKPEVIDFLVQEKNADVNRQNGVGRSWAPLHHAMESKAYAAAAMLLSLGADPALRAEGGQDAVAFCQKTEVQELRDPSRKERERMKKLAGTWSRTTSKEIVHDYEMPDQKLRLMDIFNFESRQFKSVVKDLDGGGLSHVVHFFDAMEDKTILHQALERLKDLGGDADESIIDRPPSIKRVLKPGN